MSDQRLDPDIYNATILEPLQEGRHPLPSIQTRRLKWLKKTFSEQLFQTIKNRLPLEVCENIARYCLQERAVQVVRHHWLRKDRPKPGRISVAIREGKPLWAQYVEFEGIRYVKSLSYQSLGGDESQILSNPDSDCNGIKLRGLAAYKYRNDQPRFPEDLRWSVLPTTLDPIPEPPIPFKSFLGDEIISAIDWNRPDVIGYSFYGWDNTIMKIIPHKAGEKHPYDFGSTSQYVYSWVYFPIDSDERISEAWIRRYGVKLDSDSPNPAATLILRTSKGRLLTLGPQLKYQQPVGYKTHAKYDLVGTFPQDSPCRMYFANWETSGSWMRFEGASTFAKLKLRGCRNRRLGLLPDKCKYQYSSAELEGVRTVTPCRSWRHLDGILGLLLTYEDGRKRCVGEVRLDHLLAPIEVTSDTMWIVYPETDEISWRAHDEDGSGVYFVSFEEPDADEWEGQCIKIPMRGRLDWYFSQHQCHLSHRDDSEPQDEFLEALAQEPAPGTTRPRQVAKPFSVLVERSADSDTDLLGDSLWGVFLCGFELTDEDEVIKWEKAAEPGVDKCHGRSTYPISLHLECVKYAKSFVTGSLRDLAGAAVTIRGSFNGPEEMCGPRRRWLENTVTQNLSHALRGRLPTEICRNVAIYCIREQSIRFIHQEWRQRQTRRGFISVPVHNHTTLWAQYTHFEGIRYLRSFSYDSQGGDEDFLIKGNTANPLNIFARHNHLGVNKLVITEGHERPETEEAHNYWWTCHAQQHRLFHFKARFDGIKIRNLVVVKSPKTFLNFAMDGCEIRWAVPPSPVKFSPKIPLVSGIPWTDVQSLDWNKPGTSGYSFLLFGESVVQCNFHHVHGPPVPYQKYTTGEPNDLLCLHFPMNLDERVSELWIRQYPERATTLIIIQIVTDRGRSLVLGSQQDGPGATYHVVAKLPQDKPCLMFHAHSYTFSWFHFDSVLSWEKPQARQIQPAWKPAHEMTIGTHYSSAKLYGVRDITPCINRGPFTWGDDEIIEGLLLTYYDDTRTCIGEVRCDSLGTPQKVTSDTMWIRYVEYKKAGILDENTHCCDCGIEWFGFSQPLLGSFSSHKDKDVPTDEHDSDEEQTSHQDDSSAEDESEDETESDDDYDRSPKYVSLPMRVRLDWVKESDGSICLLSHHMRSRPDDEMLHVLAEDAKADRVDPVSKSCTILTGKTTPENLRPEKIAKEFDNYVTTSPVAFADLVSLKEKKSRHTVGGNSCHSVAAATYRGLRFEGPQRLEHRRRRWLVDTFAQNLFQTLRGRIPQDVCVNIAAYCIRQRAGQAFQQLHSSGHPLNSGRISVPIHRGVTLWAQYVYFEGNRYIQSFSYASRGGEEDVVLDWETEKLLNVFVRHNGLGVSKVIVTEGDEAPNVERDEGFDGIKLRGLGISKSPEGLAEFQDDGPCEIRWAIPAAPVKHSPKIPLPKGLDSVFVRAFDWNKPKTLGYSFHVLDNVILHFNSHQAGSPPAFEEYYRADSPDAARLYLAMSPGETVSELWIRTYHERLSTLIVVTSYGRSLVIGTEADKPGATYHAIADLPQDKPCRMFYTESYSQNIGWLHFDSVSTWQHPEKRQIRPPWRPKLDDVREITPCKFLQTWFFGEDEKITGLLFTYTDGSRSSVGEIRPDELGTPVAVTSDTMFFRYKGPFREGPDAISRMVEYGLDWFGFSEPLVSASSAEESEHANAEPLEHGDGSEVDSSEGSDSDDLLKYANTMAVPMTGRLVWKVRPDEGHILSHHKCGDPKHEMRDVLAEHATTTTKDPVVKSMTNLIGKISPYNLEAVYQNAEDNDNYDIFGL
ncbi:unnamed protein product [Fusarium fujikuroi]|nr:unnamed protein product [Fusarium fujikuroi]